MPKLSEILGSSFEQLPDELKTKYKDIDLVDSSKHVSKGEYDALSEQLKTANTTINDLKKDNKDNEVLQTKVTDYEKKVNDYEKQIEDMKFNYVLEGALTNANVRNIKAVKALLNLENVRLDGETLVGLNNQLESLKETDDYLFLEEPKPQFSGIQPADGTKPSPGYNPWKEESFNLTDQGKIYKENPELAKSLMSQAGVNI
ncbi:phage scaffolding protein [Tissierellaceae bacterium HCP3S3_D8]